MHRPRRLLLAPCLLGNSSMRYPISCSRAWPRPASVLPFPCSRRN